MEKLPIPFFDTFVLHFNNCLKDIDVNNSRIGQLIFWALNDIDRDLAVSLAHVDSLDPFYKDEVDDDLFIYLFGEEILNTQSYIKFKNDCNSLKKEKIKQNKKNKKQINEKPTESVFMTCIDFSDEGNYLKKKSKNKK